MMKKVVVMMITPVLAASLFTAYKMSGGKNIPDSPGKIATISTLREREEKGSTQQQSGRIICKHNKFLNRHLKLLVKIQSLRMLERGLMKKLAVFILPMYPDRMLKHMLKQVSNLWVLLGKRSRMVVRHIIGKEKMPIN